jgi:hypothetical protein
MTWTVDIEAIGSSRFKGVCRETGLQIISKDPEHDICHRLHLAGCGDGPVQFWSSGHEEPAVSISGLGSNVPYRCGHAASREAAYCARFRCGLFHAEKEARGVTLRRPSEVQDVTKGV